MNNTQLVSRELDRAREKHPDFVDRFDNFPECAKRRLESLRKVLHDAVERGKSSFPLVLECEIREATAAHASGDYGAAIVELAQCAAVCIRAMDHVRETRRKLLEVQLEYPMVYGSMPQNLDGVIAMGRYRAVPFVVRSIKGHHPCAYIDIQEAAEKPQVCLDNEIVSWKGVEPHGGWTYDRFGVIGCGLTQKRDRWIGWDYAHAGDCDLVDQSGHRWETDEIIDEIMDVIDALWAAGVFVEKQLSRETVDLVKGKVIRMTEPIQAIEDRCLDLGKLRQIAGELRGCAMLRANPYHELLIKYAADIENVIAKEESHA